MPLRKPESADECIYFTQRDLGEAQQGFAMTWVFRENCPKCGKALMGKPKDERGKAKIRAKEYTCPSCKYTADKKEYEETLTANIEYTCPKCRFSGETQIPFRRKKIQGIDTLRFQCAKCNVIIDITKKMKEKKGEDTGEE